MLTLELINAAPQHYIQQDRSPLWEATLSEILLVRRQVLTFRTCIESLKAEPQICFYLRGHSKMLLDLYAQLLSQAALRFGRHVLTQIEAELDATAPATLDS